MIMRHVSIALAMVVCVGAPLQAAVTTGLEHYWKFDETSGGTANDSAGSLDGNYNNGIAINQTGIVGALVAADFDGNNDNVGLGSNYRSAIGNQSNLSVGVWINADTIRADGPGHGDPSNVGNTIIEGRGDRDAFEFQLGDSDDIGLFTRYGNDSNTTDQTSTTSGPIALNTWHHVATTFDGSTIRIYVDGMLATSKAASGSTLDRSNNDNELRIGWYANSSTNAFDGTMDDFGLWHATKSDQEVAALHGLGRFEALALDDVQIDTWLSAFAAEGSTVINGHTWDYITGLTGDVGATGGSIAGKNAFVVLDSSGNGMALVPTPSALSSGIALLMLAIGCTRRR